jgi:CubicO group peptidase (beta-lactamase class C family)
MDVSPLEQALDEVVPQVLRLCRAPGVSLAIGVGDEVVLAKGYGLADLRSGRAMDTGTVGPTGSDCKAYTAVAAMQLVERGLIGLDDPVNDHLHGLRVVNPHGRRAITLRDLLTHRSGLGTTFGFSGRTRPLPLGDHLRQVFKAQRTDAYGGQIMPFWATEVGANYQYSNTGLALVGYLVEQLNPEGLPFPDYVRRWIFDPLGMDSTCFPPAQHPDHVPADILRRRSVGYATLAGYQFTLPQIYIGDYPAGTALTTPSDHVRFLLAAATGGGGILRPETAEQMITPQAAFGPDPLAAIGLVWTVFRQGYFGHGGEHMWGWSSFSRAWPDPGVAVNVSTNQWDLGDAGTSDRPAVLAGRLIGDVVTAWVNGEDPVPARSPSAAQSYLAGLLVADRLMGRLGLSGAPSTEEIERIASTAVVEPGAPWDPAEFRCAVSDSTALGGSLKANVDLAGRQLQPHLHGLLKRQLGIPRLGDNLPTLD